MTHPTDSRAAEAMREACLERLRVLMCAWTANAVDPHAETYKAMAAESILREFAPRLPLPAAPAHDAADSGMTKMTPRKVTTREVRDNVARILRDAEAVRATITPAHDAVREATERVVKAWTRMDKPGAEAELNAAVDALYEAWTDAAERAASETREPKATSGPSARGEGTMPADPAASARARQV